MYKNVHVHDSISGTLATLRKEEIQTEIEKQQELSTKSLEERDKYLMEINLEDLENTLGERQLYWLLAICAARESSRLRTHNRTRPPEGRAHISAINTLT